MSARVLNITDSATGKHYKIEVKDNHIRATDLAQIVDDEGNRLASYDPAFFNTAMCTSKITFIDGDRGILRYRGYDIDELAQKSTFLEVAFLYVANFLLDSNLPNSNETG